MELDAIDEVDRPTDSIRNPVAYAFEPVRTTAVRRAPPVELDDGEESVTLQNLPEDVRVGNVAWCRCGRCIPMQTEVESVCCLDMDNLESLIHGNCITESRTYTMLCLERDVLEVSMLLLKDVRAETLERPINSR